MMNVEKLDRISSELEKMLCLKADNNISDTTEELAPSDIDERVEEEKTNADLPESPLSASAEDVKEVIASINKLHSIARFVQSSDKLSKEKKTEIIAKIKKAIHADEDTDDSGKMTNSNSRNKTQDDNLSRFVSLLNANRTNATKLFGANGKKTIKSILGADTMAINSPAGNLTPLQLLHIFQALIENA